MRKRTTVYFCSKVRWWLDTTAAEDGLGAIVGPQQRKPVLRQGVNSKGRKRALSSLVTVSVAEER
jgi:hypothetical protein